MKQLGKYMPKLLLSALLCGSLIACSSTEQPDKRGQYEEKKLPEESPTPGQEAPEASPTEAPPEPTTAVYDDNSIHVSTVEELLNAIEPGATITLEPGIYNLAEYIQDPDSITESAYVQLHRYTDDIEVAIHNIDGLSIRGIEGSFTEIVTDYQYANVLSFYECQNIHLENLTMGHSAPVGSCMGNVLNFYDCEYVNLSGMDLYGCGCYGISNTFVYHMQADNCIIRDCSDGGLTISASSDNRFNNCLFTGIAGYAVTGANNARIRFTGCDFGDNSTNYMVATNDSVVEYIRCSFDEYECERLENDLKSEKGVLLDLDCYFEKDFDYDYLYVSTAEELVEAIAPGARIILEPGEYDLSGYLQEVWDSEGSSWNDAHPYLEIQEKHDGVALYITDTDGLMLMGEGENYLDTLITVSPRYSTVLSFAESDDLAFMNLSLGHTPEQGTCFGNVMDFKNCSNVLLSGMDLYGCGEIGLTAKDGCGRFNFFDTYIHDCSCGPITMEGCTDNWYFAGCDMFNSQGGGYIEDNENVTLQFYNCAFGTRESENYLFLPNAVYTSCTWSDISNYPDVDPSLPGSPALHMDVLSVIPFDSLVLADSQWTGVELIAEDDSQTRYSGEYLYFYPDGTACLYNTMEASYNYWSCTSQYSAELSNGSESMGTITLYADKTAKESDVWLLLTMDGESYWFYR